MNGRRHYLFPESSATFWNCWIRENETETGCTVFAFVALFSFRCPRSNFPHLEEKHWIPKAKIVLSFYPTSLDLFPHWKPTLGRVTCFRHLSDRRVRFSACLGNICFFPVNVFFQDCLVQVAAQDQVSVMADPVAAPTLMADPVTIDRKNAFTAEMHLLSKFFVLNLFAVLGSCFFWDEWTVESKNHGLWAWIGRVWGGHHEETVSGITTGFGGVVCFAFISECWKNISPFFHHSRMKLLATRGKSFLNLKRMKTRMILTPDPWALDYSRLASGWFLLMFEGCLVWVGKVKNTNSCFCRLHKFVYSGRPGVLGDYDDDGIHDPDPRLKAKVPPPLLVWNKIASFRVSAFSVEWIFVMETGQEVVEASKPIVLQQPLSLGSKFAVEIWVLQLQYQHFVFFPPIVKGSFFSVICFLVWAN